MHDTICQGHIMMRYILSSRQPGLLLSHRCLTSIAVLILCTSAGGASHPHAQPCHKPAWAAAECDKLQYSGLHWSPPTLAHSDMQHAACMSSAVLAHPGTHPPQHMLTKPLSISCRRLESLHVYAQPLLQHENSHRRDTIAAHQEGVSSASATRRAARMPARLGCPGTG